MKRLRTLIAVLAALAAAVALSVAFAGTSGAVVKKDPCPGPSQVVTLNSFNDPNGYFAAFDLDQDTLICVKDD